jgi:flap endonuclease-1
MGVANLNQLLKKKCPKDIHPIFLQKDVKNTVIGIDASIYLYKNVSVSNKKNNNNYYIHLFVKQIMDFIEHNNTPIYVFDGKPPEAKQDELLRRQQKREKTKEDIRVQEEEIEQTRDTIKELRKKTRVQKDDMDLLAQISNLVSELQKQKNKLKAKRDSNVRVTANHRANLKKILDIFGLPYVQVDVGESDPFLAQMCKEGLVECVLSDDMDFLALQCPVLMKRNNNRDEDRLTAIDKYVYDDVVKSLGLTTDEFIDLCILCGCDYVESLYRIGCVTAYKLIKEHRTIERIVEQLDHKKHKLEDCSAYMEKVEDARRCFQYSHDHTIKPSQLVCHPVHIGRLKECITTYCKFGKHQENTVIQFLSNRNDNFTS